MRLRKMVPGQDRRVAQTSKVFAKVHRLCSPGHIRHGGSRLQSEVVRQLNIECEDRDRDAGLFLKRVRHFIGTVESFRPALDITAEAIDEAMDAMRKYCDKRK